jgi:hypothetical protein
METSSGSLGEPSAENTTKDVPQNVDVTSETGGYGNQNAWDNDQQTNSEQATAS